MAMTTTNWNYSLFDRTAVFVHQKIPSNHCRNDNRPNQPFRRRGCGTSSLRQIVPVRPVDPRDHANVQQPSQLPRQPARREHVEVRKQVTAPNACDIDLRVLQGMQQRTVPCLEEVDPLDGLVPDRAWLGHPVEGTNTSGEVVQHGEVPQVAPVAAQHDRAAKRIDVPEAVSALSRRSIRL